LDYQVSPNRCFEPTCSTVQIFAATSKASAASSFTKLSPLNCDKFVTIERIDCLGLFAHCELHKTTVRQSKTDSLNGVVLAVAISNQLTVRFRTSAISPKKGLQS
jgi:hypothetical protein